MDNRLPLLFTPLLLALSGAARAERGPPALPEGFIEVQVASVLPATGGGTVLLTDAAHTRLVPISVGSTEALAIALRSERRRYERPLTCDLLDAVLDEMGGTVEEVRIDEFLGGTFVAHVTFREGRRTFTLDARASDAIAVALGHGVPVWLAAPILEQAGLPWTQPDLPAVPDPLAPSL